MSPSSHIFLMRNILHHYNSHRNSKTIENMKKRLGMGVDIVLNSFGQTMLGMFYTFSIKSKCYDMFV